MRLGLCCCLVVGCAPLVPVSVTVPDCVERDAEVALALEPGPCGDRATIAAVAPVDGALPEPLAPGRYCFDAVAYLRDDAARTCRLSGVAREHRRLPSEREPLDLTVSCAAPTTELADDLLAGVAGCNGRCDVERCVCAGACAPTDLGATCPPPIDVERVVMGDHFACGLAGDHRALWCWGDSESDAALDGRTSTPGAARRVWAQADAEILDFDAAPDRLCARTSDGETLCGGLEPRGGVRVRGLFALGQGFLCRGPEAVLQCADVVTEEAVPERLQLPVAVSAGRHTVCGIEQGGIRCISPLGPESEPCAAGACWWRGTAALVPLDVPAGSGEWATIDLGWGRGCASDVAGRLWCWSELGDDPDALPVPDPVAGGTALRPTRIEGIERLDTIREVSVGVEHVCVRRRGDVACGVLELTETGHALSRIETFPGEGVILSFAAGPHGITCAVRAVTGAPNRLECFQLTGFTGGDALLGRAHTRDRVAGEIDPDRGDLAVCP